MVRISETTDRITAVEQIARGRVASYVTLEEAVPFVDLSPARGDSQRSRRRESEVGLAAAGLTGQQQRSCEREGGVCGGDQPGVRSIRLAFAAEIYGTRQVVGRKRSSHGVLFPRCFSRAST